MLPRDRSFAAWLLAALLLTVGCATRVRVPPRLDLAEWPRIGIVQFASSSEPELAKLATHRFIEMLQAAQPRARVLELGPQGPLLSELGYSQLDWGAVRALGERYDVDAVFAGDFELGDPKPSLRIGHALTSIKARADLSGRLATKLLETGSGATLWSRSSTASANVARVGISAGGLPSLGARDPEEAHTALLHELVAELRYDFYPTWRKQ